jgi:hypothetical protein
LKAQPPKNVRPHQKVEIVVLLSKGFLFARTQESLGEGVLRAKIQGKGIVKAHLEGRYPQ